MYEQFIPRLGAACGALYVVLIFGLSSTGSSSMVVLIGELFGLILFIPFLGYLYAVLRMAEGGGGWLATTVLGAGLVAIAMKLGSVAPGNAAGMFGDDTATHQALDVMNSTAFITGMLPLSALMASAAIIIQRTRVLPRWLGWLAAVTAPLLLVNGMFVDAEFGPAFLLFLLWTLLASVVLTIRPSDVGSVSRPAGHSPADSRPR